MRYKKINSYFRKLDTDKIELFIFKDYGSMGNKKYYGVEVNGRVVQHGMGTLREAKEYVEENRSLWGV